jgi:MYXO-CTERM domain-containing protein
MKFTVSALSLCALCGAASAGLVAHTGTPGSVAGGFTDRSQVYSIDDGSAENSVGLTNGGVFAGINYFAVVGGNNSITSVDVAWGTPAFAGQNGIAAGSPFSVYVWANNGAGTDPSGANSTLLYTTTSTINAANIDNNTFQSIAIPNIAVGTSFFVGVSIAHAPGVFPIAVDQDAPTSAGVSWAGGGGSFDANNVGFGTGPSPDLSGLGLGNWMIRANAVPTPGAAGLLALAGLAATRRRR